MQNFFTFRNNRKGRCVGLKSIDSKKKLEFHPKSVLKTVAYFDRPLVVYYSAVKSTGEFVHDATVIHPLPLVFFGDHFTRWQEGDKYYITIGTYLKFLVSMDSAGIMHELRNRMNWFLEYKISHPGPVSWDTPSNGIDILR